MSGATDKSLFDGCIKIAHFIKNQRSSTIASFHFSATEASIEYKRTQLLRLDDIFPEIGGCRLPSCDETQISRGHQEKCGG